MERKTNVNCPYYFMENNFLTNDILNNGDVYQDEEN